MTLPHVPDHHQPRNEDCPHNADPSQPCRCKRARNRKPYRVCRVCDHHAPHGVRPQIILSVHPNGLLELREKGRRKGYSITAGKLYANLEWSEAMKRAREKKEAKKKGRKR